MPLPFPASWTGRARAARPTWRRRQKHRRLPQLRCRPSLEPLEGRRLLSCSLPTADDYGDTADLAHRVVLDRTGSGSLTGTINPYDDQDILHGGYKDRDMFRVVATRTGRLVIRQQADNSSLDSFLRVYDSATTGIPLKEN